MLISGAQEQHLVSLMSEEFENRRPGPTLHYEVGNHPFEAANQLFIL
jgi:hypothetical protein